MERRRLSWVGAFCLTVGLTGAIACGGSPGIDEVDPALRSAKPTYTRDIKPLLARYCVSCHTHAGGKAAGVELDSYLAAHSTRIRSVCTAVTVAVQQELGPFPSERDPTGPSCPDWEPYSMPTGAKSKMTLNEQYLFALWVSTGAPE